MGSLPQIVKDHLLEKYNVKESHYVKYYIKGKTILFQFRILSEYEEIACFWNQKTEITLKITLKYGRDL